MELKPYFCPNCRSNRVKFSLIQKTKQPFLKDAVDGMIMEMEDPFPIEENEPIIECRVCGFEANENRFMKQAEREPRHPTTPQYF